LWEAQDEHARRPTSLTATLAEVKVQKRNVVSLASHPVSLTLLAKKHPNHNPALAQLQHPSPSADYSRTVADAAIDGVFDPVVLVSLSVDSIWALVRKRDIAANVTEDYGVAVTGKPIDPGVCASCTPGPKVSLGKRSEWVVDVAVVVDGFSP